MMLYKKLNVKQGAAESNPIQYRMSGSEGLKKKAYNLKTTRR